MAFRVFFLILYANLLAITEAAACPQNLDWIRSTEPVFRDRIPEENYEVASDPHVFRTEQGDLAMIYSGDDGGDIAIKLARSGTDNRWMPASVLLGKSQGHSIPTKKETPFYRRSTSGKHQIFFIGYEDDEIYDSQVFLAISNTLDGSYEIIPEPVIPRGLLANKNVHLITSPSVIEHDGRLWMTFLAWDGFEDVTEVWQMGAVSDDDGLTWQDIRIVDVPIGMEGQITKTPDDHFLATRTGEYNSSESIFISCAEHPFGPYQQQDTPALVQSGAPWEVDEIIAPMVFFDPLTDLPELFYTGADHARGWWIMSAQPRPK